ncbi:MAG: 50S ribosomal protein L13 [Proteobacteria bacterium]|nr:50S ribosomal protein L13 [Pseudomonadota bacterium]
MGTYGAKPREIERRWLLIDAAGRPLGRLASIVAGLLRGKHKPVYTPHVDTGDFVVVINADKVKLTGSKLAQKHYQRHSGIPGGFRSEPYAWLMARKPTLAIELAVRGMLPKTRLGRRLRRKLKVYAGPLHPHAAQQPTSIDPSAGPVPAAVVAPRKSSAAPQ